MEIRKILNDDVAIVIDDKNNETVVIGKALALNKKLGDLIDETEVHKHFNLEDKTINDKLGKLISELPLEHIAASEEIIKYAEKQLEKKLDETVYLTLTEHIHFAIIRSQQNVNMSNKLIWEIKRFYNEEYKIGCEALNLIKEHTGVMLPPDEAGSIALHIANASAHEEMPNVIEMLKVMQDILNIVKYYFIIEFDEESLVYFRFLTHIKFFAQRLINHDTFEESDDSLFDIVKEKYPDAYECTGKIQTYINKYYTYNITKEEMVYLIMHINRLVNSERTK